MATKKETLLEEAQALGLEVSNKNTVTELTEMIAGQARQTDETSEAEAASDAEIVDEQPIVEEKFAKAGKRSAKVVESAQAEELRQENKASNEDKPKQPVKPARSKLERRGKKFRESAKTIEAGKLYGLEEAINLAQKSSTTKFDATVELHINLGVNPRHADQNIRDNLVLPAGTGRKIRVAVLTEDVAAAKTAGADIAGTDDLLALLDKGTIDFDILVSTPQLMPKLGRYARVLGPKGLMPNPKSGTVTTDIAKAVTEAKAGRVEYRVDTTGIVHMGIGKVSFTPAQLLENLSAVLASVKGNKPQSVKGNYFKAIYITTSMGPSVKIDLSAVN